MDANSVVQRQQIRDRVLEEGDVHVERGRRNTTPPNWSVGGVSPCGRTVLSYG